MLYSSATYLSSYLHSTYLNSVRSSSNIISSYEDIQRRPAFIFFATTHICFVIISCFLVLLFQIGYKLLKVKDSLPFILFFRAYSNPNGCLLPNTRQLHFFSLFLTSKQKVKFLDRSFLICVRHEHETYEHIFENIYGRKCLCLGKQKAMQIS